MKALVFTAVFNGVAAVPLILMIGLINRDARILGRWRGGAWSQTLIWTAFAVMALAAVATIYTLIAGGAG
jgi:Mn2+/Fe2+ NRAMP family transporter